MPKASKRHVKSAQVQDNKRKQRRYETSTTFAPLSASILGMVGSLVLGSGVFGLWIADPKISWAPSLVAVGGLGLGISLWFGQPPEVAVAVGDAGVAVEGSRQTQRIHWFDIQAIRTDRGHMIIEGSGLSLKFLIGANLEAAAQLLKEAAERVPSVIDIDSHISKTLPHPNAGHGVLQNIEDDQVAGSRCAHSKKLIQLEEDARICNQCGQVYLKTHLPARCVSCDQELGARSLRA